MTEDFFRPRWRKRVARLLHVGSMGKGFYKGQDVLLRAFSRFAGRNRVCIWRWRAEGIVAHGRNDQGTGARHARAVGHVASVDELRNMLDKRICSSSVADRGLPRRWSKRHADCRPWPAALAVSENCCPTTLWCRRESEALADKIQAFLDSPELRERASNENYAKAREYHIEHIRPRRADYYRRVRDATQQWMERNGACPQ